MKPRVNSFAINAERLESSSLAPLAIVAHPFADEGTYVGQVMRGKHLVASLVFEVSGEVDKPQIDIDCAKFLPLPGPESLRPIRHKLSPGGYAMFYVSEGKGGFHIEITPRSRADMGDDGQAGVFDSRKLGPGDLFIVSLIRPGEWIAKSGAAKAVISVSQPEKSRTPYQPKSEANHITMGDSELSPASLSVGPGEGVVFDVTCPGTVVTVEMKSADDQSEKNRPKGKPQLKAAPPLSPRPVDQP